MHRASSFVAAVILAQGLATTAAIADDWQSCVMGKGDDAITSCSRLIESGKLDVAHLANAYGDRGRARLARGDLSGAIADLDRAILLNPNFAVAYNNRCLTYSGLKDYDRAIADCDQAIKLNPNLAAAFVNRCNAWGRRETTTPHSQIASRRFSLIPTISVRTSIRGSCSNTAATALAIANFQIALVKPPKYLTGKMYQDMARAHLAALGVASFRTRVPLKAVGGTFIVPVAINGAITLPFVIDSGASDVSVPSDVVSTLISRLLGQTFLKRFKSWSIDNAKHELVLEPP
jgi:tetratricopeptide (TPR) repeat protein